MHNAGLSGEPIGEPRICSKTEVPNGKLGHLQGHKDDAFNVTNEDLPGHIECTTRAAFDYIACGIARGRLH